MYSNGIVLGLCYISVTCAVKKRPSRTKMARPNRVGRRDRPRIRFAPEAGECARLHGGGGGVLECPSPSIVGAGLRISRRVCSVLWRPMVAREGERMGRIWVGRRERRTRGERRAAHRVPGGPRASMGGPQNGTRGMAGTGGKRVGRRIPGPWSSAGGNHRIAQRSPGPGSSRAPSTA